MADPVTILAILNGGAGLLLKCTGVAKSLKDLVGKQRKAQITILSLIQELDTITAAWRRIMVWSEEFDEEVSTNSELLQRLDRSLEIGALVISALEEDISAYRGGQEPLGFLRRSKVVWNETLLQDHQNRIRGQIGALSLLLQVLNLPTVERTSRLLQKFELRFQKSDESAYSIVPSRISMRIRRNSVAGTENERDISYHRLSFENDLFTARVYKRNYRTRKLRLDTNQLTDCFHSEEMISANGMLSLKHPNDVSIQNDSFMEARYPEDEQGSACFLSSQPPQEPREVNADDAGFADDKDLDLIRGLLPPINSSLGDRPWDLLKRGNLSRSFRSDVITYLRSCAMNDSARAELILPDFWNMDFVFPSAYHFIFTGAMCTAAANGRNDIIEALLSRGALANDVHRYFCKGPLHSAVRGNQFSTVDLLLRGGAEATTPNQDGSTPLHVASQRCWEDIIALLLDSGASIHDRDLKGRQPLHLASLDFDRPQIVSILVRKGANPEALDNDGHSPLHIACIKGRLASAHTLFGLGARKGCYSDFDAVVTSAALSDLPLLVQVLLGHQSEDIWTLINEFFGPKSRRLANLSWRGFKAWYGTYKTMIMVSNLKSTGDL